MDSDLIIDKGFTVLNDFKPGTGNGDKPDPIPRSPFASYASALSMPSTHRAAFLDDCSLVFTARTKEDSDGYSTGSTFFLPCLMKPRCALEELARTIFRAHVDTLEGMEAEDADEKGEKKLLYDPERSGAEWWTLVLDTPSEGSPVKECGEDDDNDEEEDDEVGMHFDADYGLEEQLPNYTLHPRVATVTYFSDTGVPTLILDKRSPPPTDPGKTSLNGSINKGWLSHPRFGKHIAFDGRYLHGGPGEFFPSVSKKTIESDEETNEPKAKRLKVEVVNPNALVGKRVTFMVNIWLNHCPIESEPLEDELAEKMATPWQEDDSDAKSNLKKGDPITPPFEWNLKDADAPDKLSKKASISVPPKESGSPAGVEEVIICNRHVDILFGASMESYHNASKMAAEEGSMPIEMEDGVFTLKVGKEASSDEEEEDDT